MLKNLFSWQALRSQLTMAALGSMTRSALTIRKASLAQSSEDSKKTESNYIKTGFVAFVLTAILMHLWPSVSPWGLFDLWSSKGSVMEWLWTSKWIFAWGAGFTLFVSLITRNKPEENREAEENLGKGFIISVIAGVTEEIVFRWALFLFAIYLSIALDFILGGFIGLHLIYWLQIYIFGPVANFFTLGAMSQYLNNPAMWAIGSAIITANGMFRDGHKYLGLIGVINSWFIGMFFFYLMFTYGLPSAILVHFLYDLFIFLVRYFDQVVERAQGNA